jgi:hypothetical protein
MGATATATKQAGSGEVDIPVSFTTTNFTLMAPGGCGSVTNNCGHVHLLIDGAMCTPAGAPYNNDGFASPINAILSNCPASDTGDGSHTVSVELHSDQHAPIVGANMMTIANSVTFTAAGDP